MTTRESSVYKGYFVTTRWASDGVPHDCDARRFSASFCVDPPDPCGSSWQQFPKATFASFLEAVANALTGAKRSIDLDISFAGGWGDRPPLARARPSRPPNDKPG